MATDIEQRCREALTAILDADSGVQALTGRTTRNCVPFGLKSATEKLPVLLLAFVVMTPVGGAGDNRRVRYQLTAVTKGAGADAAANALIERVELAITQPALAAQSLDGWVERMDRRRVPPDGSPGVEGRADCDVTLIVTK